MRTLFAILTAVALLSSVGCQCCTPSACGGSNYSGIQGNYSHHHHQQPEAGPGGPSTSTYGYPYYTTRGPRDFLVDQPPSIGP